MKDRLFKSLATPVKRPLSSLILGLCIPLLCLAGTGSNPVALEKELLQALAANDKGDARRGVDWKVIDHYVAEHLIDSRRTERSDFDDFYVLRKPALLLGHDLLVIRWGHGREDEDGPGGSRPDFGLAVYVRVNGDGANLAQFAKTNRCVYQPNEDLLGFWKETEEIWSQERPPQKHPPIRFPEGKYASLECTDEMLESE